MKRRRFDRVVISCSSAIAAILLATSAMVGNTYDFGGRSISPSLAAVPTYSGYRGVKIGMSTEETRKLLGAPKEKSDSQDYFVRSENEIAQIYYDGDHKVTAISVTYMSKASGIPTPKDVFGEDAAIKTDGSISKLVRYPKEGFWVSYNRTAGDDPIVIVTAQKMSGSSEN